MKRTLTIKFINAMYDLVDNLMGRWMDEYQYEDIKDYAKFITKKMNVSNVQILKRGAAWKAVCFSHTNGNDYAVKIENGQMRMFRSAKPILAHTKIKL